MQSAFIDAVTHALDKVREEAEELYGGNEQYDDHVDYEVRSSTSHDSCVLVVKTIAVHRNSLRPSPSDPSAGASRHCVPAVTGDPYVL